MDSLPTLSPAELNAAALETFVYKPVSRSMIRFLAKAAADVIQCDPSMMPPTAQTSRSRQPSPPREPSPRAVKSSDGALPSMEEFITQLVISSNVQVPTLMSSLVYLRRLKARLQPMAKGLRCTTHRIFLASLILAAKCLNDSSPKNKHWASYSVVSTSVYSFGFSRTEVNLMEKQLLFLLDWDLRITEDDLYFELDHFLAPIRDEIQDRHLRRMLRLQEQELRERQLEEERAARQREREEEAQMWASLAAQPQPEAPPLLQQPQPVHIPCSSRAYDLSEADVAIATTEQAYYYYPTTTSSSSRATSRSRQDSYTPSHSRTSSRDVSPPGLDSSASSYAGSPASSSSRATTPLSEADITSASGAAQQYQQQQQQEDYQQPPQEPYIYSGDAMVVCDSPAAMQMQIDSADPYAGGVPPCVPEKDAVYLPPSLLRRSAVRKPQQLLPYEISAEDLRVLEESRRAASSSSSSAAGRGVRGVLGRVFGGR